MANQGNLLQNLPERNGQFIASLRLPTRRRWASPSFPFGRGAGRFRARFGSLFPLPRRSQPFSLQPGLISKSSFRWTPASKEGKIHASSIASRASFFFVDRPKMSPRTRHGPLGKKNETGSSSTSNRFTLWAFLFSRHV